jgi:branched-chain amino acid aminotransferase
MPLSYAVKNGELMPLERTYVSAADLAVCRGYGVFDYFDVKGGVPLFLPLYLARFRRSAEGLRLPLIWSDEALKGMINQLILSNQEENCGIRLLLTGGYSEHGYAVQHPELIMLAYASPVYEESLYSKGVKLKSEPFLRTFPKLKSINYLYGLYMQEEIKRQGFDYLLYHWEGQVLESDRSNFFMIDDDDVLYTAEDDVLHGVTRHLVLEIAADVGIEVRLQAIDWSSLVHAKSAFITNTTAKMLPVQQIDDYIMKECPGDVFNTLRQLFIHRMLQKKIFF